MIIKRFFIIFAVLVLVVTASFFLLRGYLLQKGIQKVQEKVFEKYHARLEIGSAAFEGFKKINLDQITLLPGNGDTLFACNNASAEISFYRMLKARMPFDNIFASNGFMRFREYADSTDNYSFLLNKESVAEDSANAEVHEVNYKLRADNLWNRFFSMANFDFNVSDILLTLESPSYSEALQIDSMSLVNSKFNFTCSDSIAGHKTDWTVNGIINPGDDIIQFEGKTNSNSREEIPFFRKITTLKFSINKFGIYITRTDRDDDVSFNVIAEAFGAGINHWRISPEDVVLDSIRTNLNIQVGKSQITTTGETGVIINQVPLYTELNYATHDSTVVTVKFYFDEIPAQSFFNSLPKGLFSTLDGIKVKGKLGYDFLFHANLDNPDSLVFDSRMSKSEFRITGYGAENFSAINSTFVHTVREQEKVVRNILVGPENPNYIPLDMINPLLVNSVLTAEDGTFRYHHGFNEEAFRQSIATNIKEKRFARGGSTITMQLVKNVFLNRNKTISRKVEEALIVWLIENNNLVSKDRMLEVYLNIIEWGPNIYGIGEASQFYFAKHPSQLNLEESIYLSSIIPRPKTFRYTFDKEGKLKDYLKGYFSLVAGRLLRKEIITQQTFDSLSYQVELRGPALQFVIPADSIPADSLLIEEPDDLF